MNFLNGFFAFPVKLKN